MIKKERSLNKQGLERNFLNLKKIYKKVTANIYLMMKD